RSGQEGTATPDVHDRAQDRGDPHRPGEPGRLVAQERREHRGEPDDRDREDQVDPEQPPELRHMIAVAPVAAMPPRTAMPPMAVVLFMPAVPVVAAVLYVGLVAARGGLCGARPGWVRTGLVGGNGGGGLTVLRVVVTGRCRSSSMIEIGRAHV